MSDYDRFSALADWAEHDMVLPTNSATAKRGDDATAHARALLDQIDQIREKVVANMTDPDPEASKLYDPFDTLQAALEAAEKAGAHTLVVSTEVAAQLLGRHMVLLGFARDAQATVTIATEQPNPLTGPIGGTAMDDVNIGPTYDELVLLQPDPTLPPPAAPEYTVSE